MLSLKKLISIVFALLFLVTLNTAEDEDEDEEEEEEEEEDGLSLTTLLTPKLVISLFGVLLNIGVIIYFVRRRKNLKTSDYLLWSLAAADLLFTTLTLADILVFYLEDRHGIDTEILASLGRQLIWFSMYSSMFHLLFISTDRLFAVVNPFKYRMLIQKVPVLTLLFLVWLATAIIQGGIAIFQYKDGLEEGHEQDLEVQKIAGVIIFIAGCLLFICYSIIIYFIFSYSKRKGNVTNGNNFEVHACLIALTVTLGFIFFTFPIAMFPYLTIDPNDGETIYLTFECLLLFNSVFNPLVYFWKKYFTKIFRSRKADLNRKRNLTRLATLSFNGSSTITNETSIYKKQ